MAEHLSVGELMLRLNSPGHERLFQSPIYFRFSLSFRDVEDLLAERGIIF